MNEDAFAQNIGGVTNLVESGVNKIGSYSEEEEGVQGEYNDVLDLPMTDEELLQLRDEYLEKHNGYYPKIKPRQDKNKLYYAGQQKQSTTQNTEVVSSNLIFEAEETFIPQALSQNPEPVVWSDNTDEGKQASNDVKTMLQYHANEFCLTRKLGVLVRHWSIYFVGVLKYGWDPKIKDIKCEVRNPQNFIFDPNGYVDEFGSFVGDFIGEKIEVTAEKLIERFPEKKEYIILKVNGKLGTTCVYTEWWNDDFCFTTFFDEVLDKHKNEFFNYETPEANHFSVPKMPYTLLSVFSLQERPHDITNLIEQNIPNQDRINDRDDQISRNLRAGNNSIALSGQFFDIETGKQAAAGLEDGDPVLVPKGDVREAIVRLPANDIPSAVFTAQENDKITLRSVFGTQGLAPQPQNEDTTARGMILNQSHDSSRIGGGIGSALEQVARNFFNWCMQMYCVYYDEPHYAAVMGTGQAVAYAQIVNTNLTRKFIISVAPNSMAPKDELTEQNQAIQLADAGWLDPINLFKKLNDPDPINTAKMVTMFRVNPQLYMQTFFPEAQPQMQSMQAPPEPNAGGGSPEPGSPLTTLSQEPANASLSAVPLPK